MAQDLQISTQTNSIEGLAEVTISGNLTLQNSKEIAQYLQNIVLENSKISILVENETAIDMSFAQIVIATKKTCESSNKTLQKSIKIQDTNKVLLANAGFLL